jgi:hypothetical protein
LPIYIPSWLFAIVYLLVSFYGMQRHLSNVGHDAHLGGALVGLFTTAALDPWAVRSQPWLFAAIAAGTALLFIYMARNPLFLPLEGLDFTKGKARPAGQRGRSPPRSVFNFTRRKSQSSPAEVGRPERRVDAILQKISQSGLDSLTPEEKKLLDEVSDQYRRRERREEPKSGFPF